jgi:HEAT repeat protein
MRKSLIIALASLLFAAVVFMVIRHQTTSLPLAVYQGKTADEWLDEFTTTNVGAALQAFRAMGTNALPAAVNGFRKRDYPWTKFYREVYPKLPASMSAHLSSPVRAEDIWSAAQIVLLNQRDGWKFLPELMPFLQEKKNPARAYILNTAEYWFDHQNQAAAPVLIPYLEDTNASVRMAAAVGLGRIGPEAKTAIAALSPSLKDSDIGVRVEAALALWQIEPQTDGVAATLTQAMNSGENSPYTKWAAVYLHEMTPGDVSLIPVIVEMLNGSDPNMQRSSAAILGQYGRAASAAVPALENAIQTGFPDLRARALSSLKMIDPDAAAKYEQQ